jgi:hypothetical protein
VGEKIRSANAACAEGVWELPWVVRSHMAASAISGWSIDYFVAQGGIAIVCVLLENVTQREFLAVGLVPLIAAIIYIVRETS